MRYSKSKHTPWWNEQCSEAVRNYKHAFNRYKKRNSQENLVNFKKYRAISRKTIKDSKKQSWLRYVTTLNSSTPSAEVWKKIRTIKGNKTYHTIPALERKNNTPTTDLETIAELQASTFQQTSSNNNHSSEKIIYIPEI